MKKLLITLALFFAAFNIMAIIHNEETEGKAALVETGAISSVRTLNDMPKFKELKHENH